jgi:glycine/D-amino acid oxidase-like deaminating enzyme
MCAVCEAVEHRQKTDVVVVGAGQLGVTFALLFDRWRNATPAAPPLTVILIERQPDVLRGATRGSWIEHATGFEYFKRGELETAGACIQGSVVKRLLLPNGTLNLPSTVRNRFFIAAESNRSGDVVFDDFLFQARRGAAMYRNIYSAALRKWPESEWVLTPPSEFMRVLARDEYYGVSGDMVAAGVASAGGAANVPMEVLYKEAALRQSERGQAVTVLRGSSVTAIDEGADRVCVSVRMPCEKGVAIQSRYVVLTAAHGITELAGSMMGRDLPGAFHLNFMLHVKLPQTRDEIVRDYLSSVNFVLQGPHGGMYACVLPPTEHAAGFAALFAPGYDASYIDEYKTNSHHKPLLAWDSIISSSDFPARRAKISNVLERIYRLNPYLRDYLRNIDIEDHDPVVGSVFNPHGDVRSVRRLTAPRPVGRYRRVMAMTSPKWTTAELAALTLLQCVLTAVAPSFALKTLAEGFGPCQLDVLSVVAKLRLPDVPIAADLTERYLKDVALPRHILPRYSV